MKFLEHNITRNSIIELLKQCEYEFDGKVHNISEQLEYLEFHADRYLYTLKIIEPFIKPGIKILDLGAFPFHLGILLTYFTDLEINLNGLSNTQRYKLAGNGWDINIVSKIFKEMIK